MASRRLNQIFPYLQQKHQPMKRSIVEMFSNDYSWIKLFVFRMNFSLFDYRNRTIKKTYETFKPTIWIITNSWSFIIMTIIIFCPINGGKTILNQFYGEILDVKQTYISIYEFIIMCITIELMCFFHNKHIINYCDQFMEFFVINLPVYEPKMNVEMKKFLTNFYSSAKFIAISLIICNIILIIIGLPYCFGYLIVYYLDDQINLIEFIFISLHSILFSIEILFLACFFQISGALFIFCILFFQQRIKRLYNILSLLKRKSPSSSYLITQLFWNHFHNEYVKLYAEIYRFNQSANITLLAIDFMSRTSIIAACILCRQTQFLNMIPIIGFTNFFIFVNGLYSYISIIPAYNDKCCRSILQWLARSQFTKRKTRNRSIRFHYYQIRIWQKSLKSNLFIQMIINNKIGFTCGHFFHINRYKFTELILLNVPLILLFYKHVYYY
ncbi:hypothetical protein DERP_001554 [Dermatophagoides pteronyssinus]|uniref:Gustatory receptor n=1 Tax=Dermatophagoides pteronyssinus TaxID=6956 RepID=A0ABQ8JAV7_DERPT|nr:hypothetical protein DERP_001554 [Dermatophagoides pteronyssinus]